MEQKICTIMDHRVPKSPQNKMDEVQVPSSSPILNSNQESSPLRPDSTTDNKTTEQHLPINATTSLLRDRFTYQPTSKAKQIFSQNDQSHEQALKTLILEYKDLSPTLINAIFKQNSLSLAASRRRLDHIVASRSGGSWRFPSKSNASSSNSNPVNSASGSPVDSSRSRLTSLSRNSLQNVATRNIPLNLTSRTPTSKITIEKQKSSIFDRYSHVMKKSQPTEMRPLVDRNSVSSKKGKLVRGDAIKKQKIKLSDDEEDEVTDGSNAGSDLDSEPDYQETTRESSFVQVLKFLNEADPRDLADLGEISIEKANLVIKERPFESLEEFQQLDFQNKSVSPPGGKTRKTQQRKDGIKILDKIEQSIKGYNAIESLIRKCSRYGDIIADQMKDWGVSFDPSKDAELDILDVDVDSTDENPKRNTSELDIVSISSVSSSQNDANGSSKRKRHEEDDISDVDYDESDDDFDLNPSSRSRHHKPSITKLKSTRVPFIRQKPKFLSQEVELKDYQQTGINWLHLLYQNNLSCILADEMGLGKTCQVISFLAYLKQINQEGPHLVVVPSSTLENWLREFNKFCPHLKIEPYYGSQQERAELRDILEENEGQYDVIVTTYNLAAGSKYDVSFLRNRNFNVVVYDEGHMLKNSMSERFNKLMKINAQFRLLLTGTPLQNNLKELMSLLEFIMPNLFVSKKDDLATVFKQKTKTSDADKGYNPLLAEQAIERAKTMMKPFILRRKKDQVLKHLPRKHNHIMYCEMRDAQNAIYQQEIKQVMEHRRKIREGVKMDKASYNVSKNLIMALRKASIHPLLFRHIYNDDKISKMSKAIISEPEYYENGNIEYIREDMSYMTDFELHKLCCKFPSLNKFKLQSEEWMNSGKVDKLKSVLHDIVDKKHEKALVFSLFTQVLDILEFVLSTLNIKFLRLDGQTQVNDRQSLIDRFYQDDSIPVFLLSTKAGGFGINLVCANNVIIFDQSFNPHDDKQAADRAHRVGQTKEVHVTTLISKGTVEEKILHLAKNKLALDSHISQEDKKSEDDLENKVTDLLEDIIFDENK